MNIAKLLLNLQIMQMPTYLLRILNIYFPNYREISYTLSIRERHCIILLSKAFKFESKWDTQLNLCERATKVIQCTQFTISVKANTCKILILEPVWRDGNLLPSHVPL